MKRRQTNFRTPHRPQQGMSLVELMIAITLGIFLIWGVTQSFLTSKQIYNLQQGMARIQENGRLAQEFLGYDIRDAGDYGCASGDNFLVGSGTTTDEPDTRNDVACTILAPGKGMNLIASTTSLDDDFEYAVYGFDGSTTPLTSTLTASTPSGTATAILSMTPKSGTDVLMVHASEDAGVVTLALPGLLGVITSVTLDNSAQFISANGENDRVAISDCAAMRVFGVANMSSAGQTLTLSGNQLLCEASFASNPVARKITTVYYFVADNGRGGYSLYKQTGGSSGATAQELLEGVEDFQLSYGIDYGANNGTSTATPNDGVVDWYKSAADTSGNPPNSAADWISAWDGWDWYAAGNHRDYSLVRSVRYSVLMRTTNDNVVKDQQTLLFNGNSLCGGATSCANGDHRLREVFTGTVGIRSRENIVGLGP